MIIMSTRQHVLDSLQHKQPAKIPYDIRFTKNARQKMVEFYGDPDFEAKLGNCLTVVRSYAFQEVKPNIWEDPYGVQWDRTLDKDIGVVVNRLITPETLDEYTFPDPDDLAISSSYEEGLTHKHKSFVTVKMGYSLFERAWSLVGMENLFIYMMTHKPFVHILFDRILEYNLKVIENSCQFDVDVIFFGDDWGQQTGLLMGPKLWREFIKPRIREMYQLVKSKGKFVFIHSCGKVQELFPELIECGVDVFNPFQPEVMDVFEMKRRFGDRLSFYGGISTQQTLPFGSMQDIRDEVNKLLDIVGKNGGYIASPAHAIPGDAKPENIAAMIEVLQNQ
jgi:uroporphyrinogen decarboxylase